MASDARADDCAEERRKFIAVLLEELPDLYRTVVNLRYWLDYSIEEIGEVLALPPGTVKSYLFRARQQLRTLAEAQGVKFLD